jgi:hypothetical protein
MVNSWFVLKDQDPAYKLPPELAQSDPLKGVDCGWVEQMRPFIRDFTAPGEHVVDPFCGWGTTLLAALLEGRDCTGFDIEPSRITAATTRLNKYQWRNKFNLITGDVTEHSASMQNDADLILTSIPYFRGTSTDFKDNERQMYALDSYEDYLRSFGKQLVALRDILKPNRHIIIMAENLRLPDYGVIPLAWDCSFYLRKAFTLLDERIICYEKPESKDDPTISNRAHEYALIARKK